MKGDRLDPDKERRRVLRRMEWFYVYLPPVLAVVVAMLGATLLAWLAQIEGTSYWQRWTTIVLVVLGVPTAWHLYRSRKSS